MSRSIQMHNFHRIASVMFVHVIDNRVRESLLGMSNNNVRWD